MRGPFLQGCKSRDAQYTLSPPFAFCLSFCLLLFFHLTHKAILGHVVVAPAHMRKLRLGDDEKLCPESHNQGQEPGMCPLWDWPSRMTTSLLLTPCLHGDSWFLLLPSAPTPDSSGSWSPGFFDSLVLMSHTMAQCGEVLLQLYFLQSVNSPTCYLHTILLNVIVCKL